MRHLRSFLFITFLLALRSDPNDKIVVFLGDSITANWQTDVYFPDVQTINAGIGGQTSEEILSRFQSDVLSRKPQFVVIEVGTNDVYGNVPPVQTQANIEAMVVLAQSHGIQVIVCSLVPIDPQWVAFRDPRKILALNHWIHEYATEHGLPYADYYTALNTPNHSALTVDGLHPNAAGYARLVPVISQFL